MGHSVTDFRGASFTAKDYKVEVWLGLLAREIEQIQNPPEWLTIAGNHWREQAKISFNGCLDPALDRFLADDEKVAYVRQLAQLVYHQLLEFGEQVPCDFLNALLALHAPNHYPQDVATELFLAYGRALLKLLDGKMKTHEYV